MRSLSTASLVLFLTVAGVAGAQEVNPPPPDQTAAPAQAAPAQAAPAGLQEVPGAQPDSEAYPAKYSERNAALDRIPIMARPIPLSDDQKRRIVDAVMQQRTPVETVNVSPAEGLPYTLTIQALPETLTQEIPVIGHLRYVRTPKKILLVTAGNSIVVGVIPTE